MKNPEKILLLILLSTFLLRFFNLYYPNKYVFDEVYHVFTAKEYLQASKDPWDPWATPPSGVAYEWTHPPLAKEIMAVSMFLLNTQDAWAWRLPGVLLGILSVYLIYRLGLQIFHNQTASLLSAFVFSIDGLNFVQSRVGMNDVYLIALMLLSLLFLLQKRFLLSSLFLGLALASKWTAIYLIPLYFIILLKDHNLIKLIFFLIVSPLIYLLSYLPYFLIGFNFNQFINLQKQMWWYHTLLKATHDYASPWWSWPLNFYPVWYFVDYQGNKIANIFASGNSLVFWTGTIALVLTISELLTHFSRTLKQFTGTLIISLGFFIFLLPWVLSPRIMFLYHFAPSLPFLSLALGYQMEKMLKNKRTRTLVIVLLLLMIINFILIYPFLTGIHLPKELVRLFFYTNITKNPFN